MVFNTGAALLDAIVLAVVSREQEGTYGYKITQDVRKALMSLSLLCILFCEDSRRMSALKFTTGSLTEGTGDITR